MRAIPIIAVLCTGVALGALAVAAAWSGAGKQADFEQVPPPDPALMAAEIAELRQSRGTILAGTSLALSESPDDFNAALAQQAGVESIAAATVPGLVAGLRRASQGYDDHANRFEQLQRYAEADELRRLADESRRVARSLAGEPLP